MEAFGIIGMSLGSVALVFALSAMAKVAKIEALLREAGVLKETTDEG